MENVCLSQILNIRIDCRVQLFSSQYADFRAVQTPLSLKKKDFLVRFWNLKNGEHFKKKESLLA